MFICVFFNTLIHTIYKESILKGQNPTIESVWEKHVNIYYTLLTNISISTNSSVTNIREIYYLCKM